MKEKMIASRFRDRILARMLEYLGGASLEQTTTVFVSRCDVYNLAAFTAKPPWELEYYLDRGLDVGRSLWDRESFLVHLDLDYLNFSFPAEAYLDRRRVFRLQQPVATAILEFLAAYGIRPMHLVTGRGHHFVWRFSPRASFFPDLIELGQLPPEMGAICRQPCSPTGEAVPLGLTRAFVGQGRIMEWVVQQIMAATDGRCGLPVRIASVTVAPGRRGPETICLDISAFGDPLHTRVIRLPFSVYGKPRERKEIRTPETDGRIPEIFCIPLAGMDPLAAVELMEDAGQVADLAGLVSVPIPDYTEAMAVLMDDYGKSALRVFHDDYYRQLPEPPQKWLETYDRLEMESLPACIGRLLESELLLMATAQQLLVRTLLALSWHPRHIAGLIRSKYERNDDRWGNQWQLFHPAIRADFFARLFAGMIATGLDDLKDYTCRGTRDRGYCPRPDCGCDLQRYREVLQEKRENGCLFHHSVHRLFL